MTKRKKQEPIHTVYELGDEFELLFITMRDVTVCICEDLMYDKIVARHPGSKNLKDLHDSLRHLFPQYIEDAKRALTALH